jgi:hypothetical protein
LHATGPAILPRQLTPAHANTPQVGPIDVAVCHAASSVGAVGGFLSAVTAPLAGVNTIAGEDGRYERSKHKTRGQALFLDSPHSFEILLRLRRARLDLNKFEPTIWVWSVLQTSQRKGGGLLATFHEQQAGKGGGLSSRARWAIGIAVGGRTATCVSRHFEL